MTALPSDLLQVHLEEGSARLSVASETYPLDALYAAAFTFLDRCFVHLDKVDERYVVTLAPKPGKDPVDESNLQTLAGTFANELLSAAWRQKLTERNGATIELVTRTAFSGAAGPPSLDDLDDFDFSEEPFHDPLGIAESWEEKYGKDKTAKPESDDSGSTDPS